MMFSKFVSDYSGWVRRIDFFLRARHPYLKTKILKAKGEKFIIYVETPIENFDSLSVEFEEDLRFITTPVILSRVFPEEYEKEISPITDDNIPSDFEGIPLNIRDLITFIECKYPKLNLLKLQGNSKENTFEVYFSNRLTKCQKEKIAFELSKMKLPLGFIVFGNIEDSSEDSASSENKDPSDHVFNIYSSSSMKKLKLEFLERDEALWFENIENVYNGKFKKESLFFFDSSKSSCYIDFSGFKNINLRNHLLLYDVVYCTLPLIDNMRVFLENQKITRDEILYLSKCGRLKIINTQPEIRLDIDLLRCIYKESPNSIISRRAVATLCAIDMVELNDGYIFNDPDMFELLLSISAEVSSEMKQGPSDFLKHFFWPKYALRNSFGELNKSGTKRIAAYGINSLFNSFDTKLKFEFNINSEQIHIAHALDATYFPFVAESGYSDSLVSSTISKFLNMYKCLNFKKYKEYLSLEKPSISNPTQELVKIFEVSEFSTIESFEDETRRIGVRENMHSLFKKLSSLSEEERRLCIKEYNETIDTIIKSKEREKNLLKYLDVAMSLAGFVSIPVAFLSLILSGEKVVPDKLKRQFIETIEYRALKCASEEKSQISYLTKINRVARLRRGCDL